MAIIVLIGFFKSGHFLKAKASIIKPSNINFIDFSDDFKKLVMINNNRFLHKDTILSKDCSDRLNFFVESYILNENMELCQELDKLISPEGLLYGLL